MQEVNITREKLHSDLHKLRMLLIAQTLICIVYVTIILGAPVFWSVLEHDFQSNWLVWGFNLMGACIFIRYNGKYLPIDKKEKSKYTFLILSSGIIGMWLWLPSRSEINKMIEK